MIATAKEARRLSLQNASFERKVELYSAVNIKINKANNEGAREIVLTEEEHLNIGPVLVEKGYSRNPVTDNQHGIFALGGTITNSIIINVQAADGVYKYYF